jgi:hypothetical protein
MKPTDDNSYQQYKKITSQMVPPSYPDPKGNPTSKPKPWWWDEIDIKRMWRILWKLGVFIAIVYLLFKLFSGWFLLGLVPVPFWCGYLYYVMDRQSYLLLEYRIQGESIRDGRDEVVQTSKNSQIKMYKIPPDVWRKLEKIGDVFHVGERFFICDYYDSSNKKIYFSVHKGFSNINIRKEYLWLKVKDIIPALEKKLVYYVEGMKMMSHSQALDLYAQTHRQEELVINRKRTILKEVKDEQ